jgi:GT2 family glycosyltransferase
MKIEPHATSGCVGSCVPFAHSSDRCRFIRTLILSKTAGALLRCSVPLTCKGDGMLCPILAELPLPPTGKTGWPWTVETSRLPPARPDGSPWPPISIVTPSYNQGEFIEETIRSILLQGYPDLEYIVIDGGSTDQSVDIIKKYEPWLSYWVSEKDRGQSHAINKGFFRATGLLLGWLNSDDVLRANALATVVAALPSPNEQVLIAGTAECRDAAGARSLWVIDRLPQTFSEVFSCFDSFFPQSSVFFTRQALNATGPVREDLHYAMDLDLWLRMAGHARIMLIKQHLSWHRRHEDTKTFRDILRLLEEIEQVLQPHSRYVAPEIVKRTYALARQSRSRAWVTMGRRSITSGDRKNAWLAAYRAARVQVGAVASRGWIGLILRLVLPEPVRQMVFGVRAGN